MAPRRVFRAGRGGGSGRMAFTTAVAAVGGAELRDVGMEAIGPIDFGRPVQLPGGGEGEARFSIFEWPREEAPAGVRIFACQHHTRDIVWIPQLQRHANTAQGIQRVIVTSPRPESDARHMARLIASGSFERHLRQAAKNLKARRMALVTALKRQAGDAVEVADSSAGMHILSWLPRMRHSQSQRLVEPPCERGRGLYPVAPSFLNPLPRPMNRRPARL